MSAALADEHARDLAEAARLAYPVRGHRRRPAAHRRPVPGLSRSLTARLRSR